MARVRVLVLRAAGINCDEEVMHCWRTAGALPELVHINAVADKPSLIDDFQIVTIPGGFSYGDDIAAGVILAQRVVHDLDEALRRLVERGGGVLGICNGFQVLVKMGLLPGGAAGRDQVTVTYNDSARFEARWVRLAVGTDQCPFLPSTESGERHAAPICLEMPVEHAEGKVVVASASVMTQLSDAGQIAVRYVDAAGNPGAYPENPNGSDGGIAGLCDPTGRIFGLMPHPDRAFAHTHHPEWTRRNPDGPPDGLGVFLNAVAHWSA